MNNQSDIPIRLAKLEAILEHAVDAIVTIDVHGTIESANPGATRLFGYETSELIGKNVSILMPGPHQQEHDGYISNYIETGFRKVIGIGREVVGLRKDRTSFQMHLAVSEIIVNDQRFFTGVVRDISDLKEVEQKLVTAERLAAIGEMVAGLAHESRNAFQRSHACLANLAFDVQNMPESLGLVRKVQNSLDDINLLLEEVRDYSAPIVLSREEFAIEELVREVWQNVIATHSGDKPGFQVEVQNSFPEYFKGDRSRLCQVIRNLLENALFAATSLVKVSLKFGAEKANSDKVNSDRPVRIDVCDDGDGIEQVKDRLFEPFFTTKTKGTGLGLAISKRIIEVQAGRLTAGESELGGARFLVELPLEPVERV